LLDSSAWSSFFSLSRDASKVAYTRDLGTRLDVFLINGDGANRQNISNTPQGVDPFGNQLTSLDPAISQNGSAIAFISNADLVPGKNPDLSLEVFVALLEPAAAPAPTITDIMPSKGPTAGGTQVTITGTQFAAGATVSLGGSLATNVVVVDSLTITAVTGPHVAGVVDVVVTNTDGQSGVLPGAFMYLVPQLCLSTAVAPLNSGSVGRSATGPCYDAGTTLSLTAQAATDYTFSNWSGDASGSSNPLTITATTDLNITANFGLKTAFLAFPLRNKTPMTAAINSVFDHSSSGTYCADDVITAYTGEEARRPFGVDQKFSVDFKCNGKLNTLFAFENAQNTGFNINGQYKGGVFLYYDGHPGYDYRTKDQLLDGTLCQNILPCSDGKTAVLAAAPGTIICWNPNDKVDTKAVRSGCTEGPGELKIGHSNGYSTIYLHLSSALVVPGQHVEAGDAIGVSGRTGTRAAHLHFEVRNNNGVPVDPYAWSGGSRPDPYPRAINVPLWLQRN
jgi:uncharacterized repeat protein (TIGR02543 family)